MTGRPVVAFGHDVWPWLIDEARQAGATVLQLAADEAGERAEGLLVRTVTRVDASLLASMPRLRAVATASAGYDHLDLDALTSRGVAAFDARGANADAAADLTLALLLALARQVAAADADLKAGRWCRGERTGIELAGKRLGIVGIGRVGSRVARRALAFGMTVAAHDPYVSPAKLPADLREHVTLTDLAPLLLGSDVVTLHTPLNAETRGYLSRERLAVLKPGALVINCARGGLVDEAALVEALMSTNGLGGAGLDVFSAEPLPADSPLRHVPAERIVLTPHIGAATFESQRRMGRWALARLLAALAGEPPEDGRLV